MESHLYPLSTAIKKREFLVPPTVNHFTPVLSASFSLLNTVVMNESYAAGQT